MMVRVRDCGLESRVECIHQVRGELPRSIINSINRAYTNWSTFIEAVMVIDTIRLKERLELSKVIETMVAPDRRTQSRLPAAGAQPPRYQQAATGRGLALGLARW
jgi:hypothetical protein